MKYKNEFKQSAYEKFLEKKGGFLEENSPFSRNEFEKNYWKKALRYARAEAKIGKASYEISKNAEILLDEYLSYGHSKLKSYLENKNIKMNFKDRYEQTKYETDFGRFENFINVHAYDIYQGSTILEYYELYSIGILDKKEFYKIIEDFKTLNKDSLTGNYKNRSEDYNPSDYGLTK